MIVIKNEKLRKTLRVVLPFAAIPAAVLLGAAVSDDRMYVFVSFAVAVMSVLLFISGFEKRSIGSRRLVIVSVMTALSVIGRFIPFFKPVTALTVITGIYLGGEAGFLVGAMSALVSNFSFGQGPWTPFQMLAWGFIGLAAGLLSSRMKKNRLMTVLFGLLSGVFFSFAMDIWTVLWSSGSFSGAMYLSALVTAAPYTALYAVSNAVFLLICSKPFGQKLERIKLKYGI